MLEEINTKTQGQRSNNKKRTKDKKHDGEEASHISPPLLGPGQVNTYLRCVYVTWFISHAARDLISSDVVM